MATPLVVSAFWRVTYIIYYNITIIMCTLYHTFYRINMQFVATWAKLAATLCYRLFILSLSLSVT